MFTFKATTALHTVLFYNEDLSSLYIFAEDWYDEEDIYTEDIDQDDQEELEEEKELEEEPEEPELEEEPEQDIDLEIELENLSEEELLKMERLRRKRNNRFSMKVPTPFELKNQEISDLGEKYQVEADVAAQQEADVKKEVSVQEPQNSELQNSARFSDAQAMGVRQYQKNVEVVLPQYNLNRLMLESALIEVIIHRVGEGLSALASAARNTTPLASSSKAQTQAKSQTDTQAAPKVQTKETQAQQQRPSKEQGAEAYTYGFKAVQYTISPGAISKIELTMTAKGASIEVTSMRF